MIRAAGLVLALLLGVPLAGAALEALRDPALVRLAEQSGCGGTPLGYVGGYFSPADAASGIFWCRRGERYAEEGRVIIVVVDRNPTRRLWCPSVIAAINEPATLRVLVDAADGGVGEQWVCHQGAWLVRVHH